MTKYMCLVIIDASVGVEVEANSPEDAVNAAFNDKRTSVSLCHQCSDDVDIGDAYRVIVHDASGDKELLDSEAKPSEKIESLQARIAELEAAPSQTQGKVLTDQQILDEFYSLSSTPSDKMKIERIRAIIAASTSKDSE